MAKNVQYPYAYDENNNLVFIKDIERERRYDHSYHCPNCGHPMLPRLGEHNAWCFAHSENHKCGVESYIHSTAKVILAKRFNERLIPFNICLTSRTPCLKAESCKEYIQFICEGHPKRQVFDLTQYYDLPAEIEVDLIEPDGETHFKPDVLLRSSDCNRQPIFIEVFHKHKSSKEKISSGHQIIEIRVREMSDLPALSTTECFTEGRDVNFFGFKPCRITPDQIVENIHQVAIENDFNVGNESVLPPCKQSAEYKRKNYHLQRFIIYESGKTFQDGIYEDEVEQHHPSALMDITFERDHRHSAYEYFRIQARKHIQVRFCEFCEHCIRWGYTDNAWCNLGKNGTTRKNTFNNKKGTYCSFFKWSDIQEVLSLGPAPEEGKDYFVWINPRRSDYE